MKLNSQLSKKLDHFVSFVAGEIHMKALPQVSFVGHEEDVKRAFGDYDLKTKTIRVRAAGRHPLDVMRTLAHELIHHNQIIHGRAGNEDEANAIAGRIMRKYDMMHPNDFKDKVISEDGSVGAANAVGSGEAVSLPPSVEPGVNPGVRKRKLREVINTPVMGLMRRKVPPHVG